MLLPFVQSDSTKEHLKGQHQWLQQCVWKYCRAFHTEGTVREISPWNSSLLTLCTSQDVCRQPQGKTYAQEKTSDSQVLLKQKTYLKYPIKLLCFPPKQASAMPKDVEPFWREASSPRQVSFQVPTCKMAGSQWLWQCDREWHPGGETLSGSTFAKLSSYI